MKTLYTYILGLTFWSFLFIQVDLSAQDTKTKVAIKGAQITAKALSRALVTNPRFAAQLSRVVGKSVVEIIKNPKLAYSALGLGGATGATLGYAHLKNGGKVKPIVIYNEPIAQKKGKYKVISGKKLSGSQLLSSEAKKAAINAAIIKSIKIAKKEGN